MSLTIRWRARPLANSLKGSLAGTSTTTKHIIAEQGRWDPVPLWFNRVGVSSLPGAVYSVCSFSTVGDSLTQPRSPWCRSLCVPTVALPGTPLGEATTQRRGDYSKSDMSIAPLAVQSLLYLITRRSVLSVFSFYALDGLLSRPVSHSLKLFRLGS